VLTIVVVVVVVVTVAVVEAPLPTTVVTTAREMPSFCDAAECNATDTTTTWSTRCRDWWEWTKTAPAMTRRRATLMRRRDARTHHSNSLAA